MTEPPRLLAWSASGGSWETVEEAGGELRVADSWLVAEGRVRGWDLHMERFTESCVAAGAERAGLGRPLAGLPELIPRQGEWFPRLEMRSEGEADFYFRLRPSPPRWETAAVWPTSVDPRREPRVKGPDIDRLMALRSEARAHDADEAAILNDRDEVIEAAACSILWWREGALARVGDEEPILNGVTRRLLAQLAERFGVEVEDCSLPIAEVGGHEVWLANALIGIVPVTRWVGHCDHPPVDHERLAVWREGLAELAAPVRRSDPCPPRLPSS